MSAEENFFRVEYNNRLDNDGDECVVPTVWFGSQGFDLVRQYDQGEQSALEHAKWYVSMFEKAMESYAREYHAKEMERKLEEAKNDIEEQYPEQDEETNGYYDYDCEKRKEGAKWLLNHLKQKQ